MYIELSKEEVQALIIRLDKELFEMQRNAEIHGYYDSTLPETKTALDKLRKRLGEMNKCEFKYKKPNRIIKN